MTKKEAGYKKSKPCYTRQCYNCKLSTVRGWYYTLGYNKLDCKKLNKIVEDDHVCKYYREEK